MTTTDPLSSFGTNVSTPQRERVPGRHDQVQNNEGGFVFQIDPMEQFKRFLTMGTTGGTYYVGEAELTKECGELVLSFTQDEWMQIKAIDELVMISLAGRAPKQNPTLFALAIFCQHGTTPAKQHARKQITKVVRTGTHLFIFVRYLKQFGGWSRGLRKAVGAWYTEKGADRLAYQLVKYRQREGYTHRDVLRLTHPKIEEPAKRSAVDFAIKGDIEGDHPMMPDLIEGYYMIQRGVDPIHVLGNVKLPWEALPDSAMNNTGVWDKLLDNGMPVGALLRQLPRLTKLGMLPQMGGRTDEVVASLLNPKNLKAARIHPINVLNALATYRSGHGFRGQSIWTPTAKIVDGLDEMFYASFGYIEPANKRTMLAIDASASMTWDSTRPPNSPLDCREISAAMAMVAVRTEPYQIVTAFSGGGRRNSDIEVLPLSKRQRLDDVVRTIAGVYAGGTDCSLPMIHALHAGVEIDTFVIYTDNDTWAGPIHPFQALQQYRKTMGVDAKLIVCAMTPSQFSIADPRDPGMLDISGFDSAVPTLISDFSAGRV